MTYNADRLEKALRENNNCIYYTHDASGRVKTETWKAADHSIMYAFRWDFDNAGNRVYEYKSAGTATETYYEFNSANRPTKKHIIPDDTYIYYQYDGRNNLKRVDEPTESTYFEYDPVGRVKKVTYKDAYGSYISETFGYDALGRQMGLETGNWKFGYDGFSGENIVRSYGTTLCPRLKGANGIPVTRFYGGTHTFVKNNIGQIERVLGGAGTVTMNRNWYGGWINEYAPPSSLELSLCRYENAQTPSQRRDILIDDTSYLSDDGIKLPYEMPMPLNSGHAGQCGTGMVPCSGNSSGLRSPQVPGRKIYVFPDKPQIEGKPQLIQWYTGDRRWEVFHPVIEKLELGYHTSRVARNSCSWQYAVNVQIDIEIAGFTTWGELDSATLIPAAITYQGWEWPKQAKRWNNPLDGLDFKKNNYLCRIWVKCKGSCKSTDDQRYDVEWVPQDYVFGAIRDYTLDRYFPWYCDSDVYAPWGKWRDHLCDSDTHQKQCDTKEPKVKLEQKKYRGDAIFKYPYFDLVIPENQF